MLATQNPIESEGTYPLPEAQIDRFLFKVLVDYPTLGEEASIVGRSLRPPEDVQVRLSMPELVRFQRAAAEIFVDREVVAYAVQLVDGTRNPERYGLGDLRQLIQYGASPRGAIGMVQAARALALLRGRRHALCDDVRDLAADVLRHRIVLSYDALSDGVTTDDILDRILGALADGRATPLPDGARRRVSDVPRRAIAARPARAPGAGADPGSARRRARAVARAARRRRAARRPARARRRQRHRARAAAPLPARRRRAPARSGRERAHRHRARAPAGPRADPHDLARRSTSRRRWRSARPTG